MPNGAHARTIAHGQGIKQELRTLKQGRWLLGPAFIFLPRIASGLLASACAYCCFRIPPRRDELQRLMLWTALVAAYPLLSALWALEPRRSVTNVGVCIAIAVASVLVFRRTGSLKETFWPAVAYGVPAIVFVSLIDVLLDVPIRTLFAELGVAWVGQPATVGKTGHIEQGLVNWSMTILTLSLFPYLNATREPSKGQAWKQALRLSVVAALLLAALLSTHESSKVAICVGMVVYGLAQLSKRFTLGLVLAGWLLSVAATPLIMSAVLPLAGRASGLVQSSLEIRFRIWRVALNDIATHPWRGTGIGSTRAEFREKSQHKGTFYKTGIAAHSHNWFLDLWRELGAIGAACAAIWIALIAYRLFERLPHVSPELIAFTGLVLTMSTASFSLWAPWYLCAIGLSFAMFGLTKARPTAQGAPGP